MAEEKEFHRRSIRIRGADYTQPGGYFVTICTSGFASTNPETHCTAERGSIFGKIEDGLMKLTALGEIARRCWVRIPEHFANASMKEFVVMPNHVHGIIALGVGARYIVPFGRDVRTPEQFQKPVKGSIPTIVRTFKAEVTRAARKEIGFRGGPIWQRNYFERVLRDGREYRDASRYILENPKRWSVERETVQDGEDLWERR